MDVNAAGLVVVANRLPVAWDEGEDQWTPSPGGLVSALSPILQSKRGTWVGWPGTPDRLDEPFEVDGIRQVPVSLSAEEVAGYYEGFCNGTIWPLYHDAIRPVEMHRHWWRPYVDVNRRFTETVLANTSDDEPVWVHDYQLQLVPRMLRERTPNRRIGFFLHIPFPPVEIFGRLPWRSEVIAGLLGADVVGFQTRQDALNFARAAREYGRASGPAEALAYQGRTVTVESVPISIDTADFRQAASSHDAGAAAHRLRQDLGTPRRIILGVDRLDYTKGIDLRLRAFQTLLERRPDLVGDVVFVQVAVPSRESVGEYQIIRERIEQMVGHINGEHARPDWVPVHYLHRSLPREELVAYYRAADVMLITPLRDGMNLVAKEYIACRVDGTGVLVLSEFAGAAEQLDRAMLVNPYDVDGLALSLERAVELPAEEQRERMRSLRRTVTRWDVYTWAEQCLEAILS
ncbi:MAG: trehalose-6-phosphate synthase [Acidimicrobiia bacterium]